MVLVAYHYSSHKYDVRYTSRPMYSNICDIIVSNMAYADRNRYTYVIIRLADSMV